MQRYALSRKIGPSLQSALIRSRLPEDFSLGKIFLRWRSRVVLPDNPGDASHRGYWSFLRHLRFLMADTATLYPPDAVAPAVMATRRVLHVINGEHYSGRREPNRIAGTSLRSVRPTSRFRIPYGFLLSGTNSPGDPR